MFYVFRMIEAESLQIDIAQEDVKKFRDFLNAGFKSRLSLIDIFGAALRDKIDFSDDKRFKGNAEDTGGLL